MFKLVQNHTLFSDDQASTLQLNILGLEEMLDRGYGHED
jgi:hypothetical protein